MLRCSFPAASANHPYFMYLFSLFSFSLDDRGSEASTGALCLMGAEVLPLFPAPGSVVLLRSLCPSSVLQQGCVQEIKLQLEFLYTVVPLG